MTSTSLNTSRFLELVDAQKKEGLIILAFANKAYLEVLLNWAIAIDRLDIKNYLIISLDSYTHNYLSERNIPSVLSTLEGGLDMLWIKRIELFEVLISNGISFVHSDSDAVWLKNPIPRYFDTSKYDLIFSQGTVWPPDVVLKRGFVFCCGLFSMRDCNLTQLLLREMMTDVKRTGDDQVTLNRVLDTYDIEWVIDRSRSYMLTYNGYPFLCSEEIIAGQSSKNGLKICLLPHHEFQRVHMPERDAYVKHLLSPKTAPSKIEMFRETNCLYLDSNWRCIEFDVDSLQKIGRGGTS